MTSPAVDYPPRVGRTGAVGRAEPPAGGAGPGATSRLVFTLAAAVALAHALAVSGGTFDKGALGWIGLALVCCLAGWFGPPVARLEAWGPRAMSVAAGAAACVLAVDASLYPLGWYLQAGPADRAMNTVLVAVTVVLASSAATAAAAGRPWLERWHAPALIVVHVLLGVWMIRHAPEPRIDVWHGHQHSLAALLDGRNPYSATYPDIYGEDSPFHAPGMVKDGRTTYGYSYPPLSLLMALPGYALWGEYRYALLAAVACTTGLMFYTRPGRVALVAGALFVLVMRTRTVLESGWNEPFVLVLLAVTAYCAARARRWLPVALGLLLACKQYSVLFVPAIVLLLPRPLSWRDAVPLGAKAAAVALAVSLPIVLWDVGAFWHSAVRLQFVLPFRADSLSFPVLVYRSTGTAYGGAGVAWLMWAAVAALLVWRGPRSPAGFAFGCGLLCLTYFAFSKAFLNYYWLVVGALFLSLAVDDDLPAPARPPALPGTRGHASAAGSRAAAVPPAASVAR